MTDNGFQIVKADFGSMMSIKKTGQGPAPKELRGLYTSTTLAQKAIDTYLARKKPNAKTGSRSTD